MAPCKIAKVKVNVFAFFSFLCVVMASILFTIGGIFYAKDNYKRLYYANAMCLVKESSSKSYKYEQYFVHYVHHVSKWSVRYNSHTATVEGTKLHKSASDAIKEANKYKVSKY